VAVEDITVLLPARTSLPALETALDGAGIPFRTEASSLVYLSEEVQDVLMAARAVDDPTDELAIVTTLRSALVGCGDDDLWAWRRAGGRWGLFTEPPTGMAGSPVGRGLAWLADLARQRSHLTPSQLLERIVDDGRVLEVAVEDPAATGLAQPHRHREVWRRVRFVVDQARAWSTSEGGSLREYLAWAARQGEEQARVVEAVLPETDTRSVRITTVHAAKGLQFPMVVLSGLTTETPSQQDRVLWPDDGTVQFSAATTLRTLGWDAASQREVHLSRCETRRLLYVAATRAESRLVVSLHRTADATDDTAARATRAAQLAWAGAAGAGAVAFTAAGTDALSALPAPASAAPPPREEWRALWASGVEAAQRPAAVSATDVAHGRATVPLPRRAVQGLDKRPRDLELPPWAKGRYGTAVGRAVHAVMQSVDLATGAGLHDLVASAALAEGVADLAGIVEALAQAALDADAVQRAAARRHWRETYVSTELGGMLVEGYIDLLYEEDDGSLVVVDYKTDAAPWAETLEAYGVQLGLYCEAVANATGREARAELVLCGLAGVDVA
jgi:ATP-dependent exoDNAse (exonuclease V) beta subunit